MVSHGGPSKPVKVHLLGITELYDGGQDPIAEYNYIPAHVSGKQMYLHSISVVFVHGIQGHPKDTWTYTHGATSDPAAQVKKQSFFAKITSKGKKKGSVVPAGQASPGGTD